MCSCEAANASVQQSIQVVHRLRSFHLPLRGCPSFLPELRDPAYHERTICQPPLCDLRVSPRSDQPFPSLPPSVARHLRRSCRSNRRRRNDTPRRLQNSSQHSGGACRRRRHKQWHNPWTFPSRDDDLPPPGFPWLFQRGHSKDGFSDASDGNLVVGLWVFQVRDNRLSRTTRWCQFTSHSSVSSSLLPRLNFTP